MQPEPILVRKSKEHPFAARFGTQQMRSGQLVAQSARVGSAKDAFPRMQGDAGNPMPDADIPTSPKIFHLRQLRHGAEHSTFLSDAAKQAFAACFSGQEARAAASDRGYKNSCEALRLRQSLPSLASC